MEKYHGAGWRDALPEQERGDDEEEEELVDLRRVVQVRAPRGRPAVSLWSACVACQELEPFRVLLRWPLVAVRSWTS